MNTKTLIAGLLAGVVAYLLGWLLYGMALADTTQNLAGTATGVMKSDSEMMDSMIYLIIGELIYGALGQCEYTCRRCKSRCYSWPVGFWCL